MDSVDFKLSHAIGALAGGDAALAVGGEYRRERTSYNPSELLLSDCLLYTSPSPRDS